VSSPDPLAGGEGGWLPGGGGVLWEGQAAPAKELRPPLSAFRASSFGPSGLDLQCRPVKLLKRGYAIVVYLHDDDGDDVEIYRLLGAYGFNNHSP